MCMKALDIHTTSPLVIVVVWAGILFGLGVGSGAALGWLIRNKL